MKYISKIYNKFINIDSNKKQIIFALFAYIILYLITKSDNQYILKSAVPAAVAAGAKAIGKAALKGAEAGAVKGAVDGSINGDEDNNKLNGAVKGAVSGAKSGAVSGTISGGKGLMKNTKSASSQNINGADQIKNKPAELDDTTSKTSKKESSMSETEKSKKGSSTSETENSKQDIKKYRMDSQIDSEEDEIDDGIEEGSSEVLGKNSSKNCLIGCLIAVPFIFLLFIIPILVTFIISPTNKIISVINCNNPDGGVCTIVEKFTGFMEKSKNFILYGNFDDNGQVIADKAIEVSNEIFNNTNIKIDIPLMLSSIMADISIDDPTSDEDEEVTVSDRMNQRIEYLKELGELQIVSDSVVFICKSKVVNGVEVYYNELDYTVVDSDIITETECNAKNLGKYVKETMDQTDIEGYYVRLEENKDILEKIYGKDKIETEEQLNLLIDKIRLQRDLFKIMYDSNEEEIGAGNVPLEFYYDTNINLQTPLKDSYSITSFYGQRTGIFAGFHKGIDIVSINKNIYAAGDGVVTNIYHESLGGNVIEITHTTDNGVEFVTQYAHLKQFLVTKGDIVKSGDIIGIMGDTGNTSGVHLHFQMWESNTKETYNPLNLFDKATNYPS